MLDIDHFAWDIFVGYSTSQLCNITHTPGWCQDFWNTCSRIKAEKKKKKKAEKKIKYLFSTEMNNKRNLVNQIVEMREWGRLSAYTEKGKHITVHVDSTVKK